ncbi:MAG: lipoyl(octanoyl) transferase [Deltaproteobacteria bacterium CG_4_8_14_3_um_filter_45_9]|nr:MAG: lipoyl(octanoyl) transferase [Deltaproteobacteria bacterium CG03_land_8_20_14_0_80_45_14]PIX24439.1 MAG: lipoyl(octanoyl) transferase [Deltaproteobacteria bacterium CG_4_8_14_3_um_filter_45_9]
MNGRGYIIDLGLIDYQKAWELQRQLWSRRVEEELPDLLLILEHPHVITLGRRGNRSHLIASSEVLEAMKIPIFHVERGGDVTYHGPGQMVVYPILDLKEYGYRLIRYIGQLEEVILRVLIDFRIQGERDPLNRGVWVDGEKIASVGVAIKRWVSFHGFSLNYETNLKYFELINPCGLEGKKMTSMAKILGKEISRERLWERISFHSKEVFQKDWEKKELKELIAN